MEKQGRLSSYEQPSESSSQHNNKLALPESESLVYQFDWFPITTSPWVASVSFVFQVFLVVHTMDFYADNAGRVFGNTDSLRLLSPFIVTGIQSIAYTLCTMLSLLSVLSLVFNNNEEVEGYKYLLCWVGSKLFPVLRYMIDINVALAAFFLIREPLVTLIFTIAAAVNIAVNFFGQNYTLRKDYLCCKKMQYLLMWKLSVILGYSINCVGYYVIDYSRTALIVLLIISLLIFAGLLVCYFLFGYLIYRHTSSQIFLLFLLNIFCAMSMGNLYDAFLSIMEDKFAPNRNLILSGCFFCFLSLLSYCVWTNIKKNGSSIDNVNPIKKNYFLFNKLENSSESISDDCQIRGIVRYHLSHVCTNPNCFVNQGEENFFDSKKNKFCFSSKINQGKTSFVKFIAKCAYEQQLDNCKWANTELLLDYIQFYYMKLKNLFRVSILLVELEKKFMTPFQRIRLTRLRRVMMEENRKLNEELYNGNLDLENLIVSENKFDQIQQQIKEVLSRNVEFWKYLENDSINLSSMVKMMRPNFVLIDKINNNWKSISKYFQIQKVWKFIFVCYTLYVRNQKLKPQFIEEFGQVVHEEELFSLESQHIDKTTESSKMFVPKMIFEQDVCCMHINHSQDKPIIKGVSRYFQRIFGYNNNEIIESSLDIMLAPCFREVHKKLFMRWAGLGKSNKENNYEVKKVFPISKDGYVVSTFKYYKQFLCLNKELQYVAMFKRNKEEEYVIILNSNYEIEGMTCSVAEKLNLTTREYQQMVGLNLLVLIPGLIENTKFGDLKTKNSETFSNQMRESSIRASSNNAASKGKRVEISTKKQFTKNNLTLSIPNMFEPIREAYTKEAKSQEMENIFEGVVKGYRVFSEVSTKNKFKVEIEVKQVQIDESASYLEFYLREIQQVDKVGSKLYEVGKFVDAVDSDAGEQSINQADINKFFENSQSSQNISLAFNDNIFIKQDNNEPVAMISHVSSIAYYVRIVFVLFFGLLIGSLLFEYNNYQTYKQNALKMTAVLDLQLKTLILNNQYYSQVVGLSGTRQTIGQLTASLRNIRENNIELKKSLLDTSINQKMTYLIKSTLSNNEYDQIDIIDKMFEDIIQIMYNQGGNVTLNMAPFDSFQSIVLPYIEELTFKAIQNISDKFDAIFKNMEIKNNVYIGVGIVLLISGFLLVLSSLIKITKSFVSLMEIFTQFSEIDLRKVIRYCQFLENLFSHLNKKYDQFKQTDRSNRKQKEQLKYDSYQQQSNPSGLKLVSTQGDGIVQDEHEKQFDNANLNKKVKKVENGKEMSNMKLKLIIYVVIFLVFYGLAAFGLNLYASIINKSINEYKESGYEIFQYYSATNIKMISFKERLMLGDRFDYKRYSVYKARIQQMKSLKQREQGTLNSQFIGLRNDILFGNICLLYPEVLPATKHTIPECQTIASNNLQHGLLSFVFYMAYNVDFYMNTSSNATPTYNTNTLTQIEMGLEIANSYLEFLLRRWAELFIDVTHALNRNIIIICACLFVFQVLIYIIMIEVLIVGNLKDNFLFFRKIYNNMAPDFIVTKEKIIKAKLEVEGIIKK